MARVLVWSKRRTRPADVHRRNCTLSPGRLLSKTRSSSGESSVSTHTSHAHHTHRHTLLRIGKRSCPCCLVSFDSTYLQGVKLNHLETKYFLYLAPGETSFVAQVKLFYIIVKTPIFFHARPNWGSMNMIHFHQYMALQSKENDSSLSPSPSLPRSLRPAPPLSLFLYRSVSLLSLSFSHSFSLLLPSPSRPAPMPPERWVSKCSLSSWAVSATVKKALLSTVTWDRPSSVLMIKLEDKKPSMSSPSQPVG